jgi:dolichol kinase
VQFPDDIDRQQGIELQRVSLLRKLIHVAMAIIPLTGWWASFDSALSLAGVLVAASLAAEGIRRWLPGVNLALWRLLPSVFRESEDHKILGSTWFAIGALAALLLEGRDAGGTAILFLAWGDPAAEFAGHRWGSKVDDKTLAGTAACFVACLVGGGVGIVVGGLNPWVALGGAAIGTLIERWSPPPDDNLWMPVVAGVTMAAAQRLV